MPFHTRHIFLFCILPMLPGLAAGLAYGENGQGVGSGGVVGNSQSPVGFGNAPGPGADHGGSQGPGGPGNGGLGGPAPGGFGNNGQGIHGNGPGFGNHNFGGPPPGDHGGGHFSHFGLNHPQPPSAVPPPATPPVDGDNGAGDDTALNQSLYSADFHPVEPEKHNPPASPAAQFVKTPILDQDQSKFAVQNGKAASMPLLFTYLDQKYPGQVLDVKLHATGDGLVYEVRYLADAVELRTLFLDAMTLSRK